MRLSIIAFVFALAGGVSMAAQQQATKPPAPAVPSQKSQKPVLENFATLEDWVEAEIAWSIDQRVTSQAKGASLASPTQARFVFVTPAAPGAGSTESGYSNFIWRLDTETGEVTAFRLALENDAKGDLKTWEVLKLAGPFLETR